VLISRTVAVIIRNALARAVVAAPRSSNPDQILKKRRTGSGYKNALNGYKLLQPSSPHYLRDLITVQPYRFTRSIFSNHQFTPVSRSQTTFLACKHLTCGTSFLILFMFLISLVHHHHPALTSSSYSDPGPVVNISLGVFHPPLETPPFLKVFRSIAIYLLLRLIWNFTTSCLVVTGGGSVGECDRLSQPS